MDLHRRKFDAIVLAVLVAVLLPAGVLAATTMGSGPTTAGIDKRVGVAAASPAASVDDQPTTTVPSATVPTTVAPSPPTSRVAPSTTTPMRPPTPTTLRTTTTRATTPTTAAPLTDPNWLTVGNLAPAGMWQTAANGVSIRLRIDPVAPVAGQPVRFFIEVASAGACCTYSLNFGDGATEFMVNGERTCSDPSPFSPGPHNSVTTHTYTSPGAYKARLWAMSGDPCATPGSPVVDPRWMPWVVGTPVYACIGVGPGPASQAGCPVNDR